MSSLSKTGEDGNFCLVVGKIVLWINLCLTVRQKVVLLSINVLMH